MLLYRAGEFFILDNFKTFQLAVDYYQACKALKLPTHLKDQMLRASARIALNAAEGSAKRTLQDQRRYYFISLGSLRETQAILALERIEDPTVKMIGNLLGACLFRLCHPNQEKPLPKP